MKNRAGFTLVEVMIALTLTAVLGAVAMGAFVSQSRFFDHQEKVGAARAVSRGAMNIMMSEMRMIELGGGIISADNDEITMRVPTAFGVACAGTITATMLPSDLSAVENVDFSGWAYRLADGTYKYMEGTIAPGTGLATICAVAGILPSGQPGVTTAGVLTDGTVLTWVTAEVVPTGTPIFFYNIVTYAFAASTMVPGTVALWRELEGEPPEELVAPFASTAQFRFFVNDAATATATAPATLTTITGVEIVLDGVSERPNSDGTFQTVPLTTAVYFKNR